MEWRCQERRRSYYIADRQHGSGWRCGGGHGAAVARVVMGWSGSSRAWVFCVGGREGTARGGSARVAGIAWATIPAGTFQMGCVPGDPRCAADEKPRHAVTISTPVRPDDHRGHPRHVQEPRLPPGAPAAVEPFRQSARRHRHLGRGRRFCKIRRSAADGSRMGTRGARRQGRDAVSLGRQGPDRRGRCGKRRGVRGRRGPARRAVRAQRVRRARHGGNVWEWVSDWAGIYRTRR